MTLRTWTLLLLVTNAILLLINAYGSALVYRSLRLNESTAEMNRQITEQLPPHPCRSAILPGESCIMRKNYPYAVYETKGAEEGGGI